MNHRQKWMHTHAIRLLLAHDQPLPERIFTAQSKGRFVQCSAELAWNELQNHLKRWANFSLVRDQTYVCLLYEGQFERQAIQWHFGNCYFICLQSDQEEQRFLEGARQLLSDPCFIGHSMRIATPMLFPRSEWQNPG